MRTDLRCLFHSHQVGELVASYVKFSLNILRLPTYVYHIIVNEIANVNANVFVYVIVDIICREWLCVKSVLELN